MKIANPPMTDYIIVAHYQDETPYKPERDMEKDMVQKLEKMGFNSGQIRIMFEQIRVGLLLLEIENVELAVQLNHKASAYRKMMDVLKEKYEIDFANDEVTNRMKGVKNLQRYVGYLDKKQVKWTYLNVYDGPTKNKIGSIYHDEPIPARMIE